ncbi:hypothetical protein MtrunA17_Chr8g0353391 [Medicago truncatula]|uniref:Uncharacterized protein n=1 Tax=Medicago truncatula TaxID=3880 RepID=A0A396GGE5_MEDTR|nr:hypothetical protein MtrunA17_Chr8g0353391 [Medicago truncatula]
MFGEVTGNASAVGYILGLSHDYVRLIPRCAKFYMFVLNYSELVQGNFRHSLELVFSIWTNVMQPRCFGTAPAT